MPINRAFLVAVALLTFSASPVEAQEPSDVGFPWSNLHRQPALQCHDWAVGWSQVWSDQPGVVPLLKLEYLQGLEYGSLSAMQTFWVVTGRYMGEQDSRELFADDWTGLLVSDRPWEEMIPAIDEFCKEHGHPHTVPVAVQLTIAIERDQANKAGAPLSRSEEEAKLMNFRCANYLQHGAGSLIWAEGYWNGYNHVLDLALAMTKRQVFERMGDFFRLARHPPHEKALARELDDFCRRKENAAIPFTVAHVAVDIRAMGDEAEAAEILEPFYSKSKQVSESGDRSAADIAPGVAKAYECGKILDMDSERQTQLYKGTERPRGTLFTLTVHLGRIFYTVEHKATWWWSYQPTDLIVGDPVEARIEKDNLYVRRLREPGKELKTKIRRRERAPFAVSCFEP